MKYITKATLVLAVAMMAFSCTNKELESRIAKLEGKVAELESTPGGNTPFSTVTPVEDPNVKPEGPLPSFEFEEESYDFGTINEGDIVTHIFKFTNTGDAPLVISSATASCGCTVPEWPREPIAAGAEGEIKVQFNSRKKPGVQNKTVTITANTYPKINRVRIKANVLKAEQPS